MKYTILVTSALAATISLSSAATTFNGGVLTDAGNWSNGLPGSGNDGTINVNGSYTGINQADNWTASGGAAITVGGGAVLTVANDFAASNATWIINNATINATDDFFLGTTNTTVYFNAGSTTTAGDQYEINVSNSRIVINGGTHSGATGNFNYFGVQNPGSGSGFDFLGGSVTAGAFRFLSGSINSVGGSATLSGNRMTGDSTGTMDFLSGWTGSWTVGDFVAGSWESRLTTASNGFRLDGAEIDATSFANNFEVSADGKTLTAVPEPSSAALFGLGGLALIVRRRK